MRWFMLMTLSAGCSVLVPGGTTTDPTTHTGCEPQDTGLVDIPSDSTCDDTTTTLSFLYCQSDLCNLCEGDGCDTLDETLSEVIECTGSPSDPYACCTLDACTDRTLGSFDRLTCPGAYGDALWWFDPTTGELVGFAYTTDYNGWCDGDSIGELFGPDLRACL